MSPNPCKLVRFVLVPAFLVALVSSDSWAQGKSSWLDRPVANWNSSGKAIPKAAKGGLESSIDPRCKDSFRAAETATDRQLLAAGWTLFGAIQSYEGTRVLKALSGVDGMCRPLGFYSFVFVGEAFAGTLTPEPMDSRADGVESQVWLTNASTLFAEFSRYKDSDPLCCPSEKFGVQYQIQKTAQGPVLVPNNIGKTGGK